MILDFFAHHSIKLIVCSLITILLFLLLRKVAVKFSLVDKPNSRKLHPIDTPLVGGLVVCLSSLLSFYLFVEDTTDYFLYINICSLLMLLLGLTDDLFDVKARQKLLVQVLIVTVLLVSTDIHITSLGNVFWFEHAFLLGPMSFPLTLFAIVVLTNAFNMIDGCDGLAGCLALFALVTLLYFGSAGFTLHFQTLLLLIAASLIVFLPFNFSNNPSAKIFLGDGGSLFCGFIVSIALIQFAESNTNYSPSMVIWFVAVPVLDFCAVIIRRLVLGRRLMFADRSHIHHFLLSLGFSHLKVTIILLFLAIVLLGLGIFIEEKYPKLSLLVFLLLFLGYTWARIFRSRVDDGSFGGDKLS